jgi:hypothetical protein
MNLQRSGRRLQHVALARVGGWALICVTAAVIAGTAAIPCRAADLALPPVNLGDTSFQDGIAFPGWLVETSVIGYHANSFRDANGEDLSGQNRATAVSSLTHIAWISNYKLLGGFYGAEVVIPFAGLDVDTDFGPNGRERGLGDVVVGPLFIQWSDSTLWGMPYFHRVNFDFILPTGEYRRNSSLNVGSNVYSFNPYYAFTLVPSDRWEVSARLHYLWNSENPHPFSALGANDSQPGQAVHLNVAASYEVVRNLRLGLSGYALRQVTDDQVDGVHQSRSKELVIGFGPGLKYTRGALSVYLNTYYETAAENRFEGVKGLLRASMVF